MTMPKEGTASMRSCDQRKQAERKVRELGDSKRDFRHKLDKNSNKENGIQKIGPIWWNLMHSSVYYMQPYLLKVTHHMVGSHKTLPHGQFLHEKYS